MKTLEAVTKAQAAVDKAALALSNATDLHEANDTASTRKSLAACRKTYESAISAFELATEAHQKAKELAIAADSVSAQSALQLVIDAKSRDTETLEATVNAFARLEEPLDTGLDSDMVPESEAEEHGKALLPTLDLGTKAPAATWVGATMTAAKSRTKLAAMVQTYIAQAQGKPWLYPELELWALEVRIATLDLAEKQCSWITNLNGFSKSLGRYLTVEEREQRSREKGFGGIYGPNGAATYKKSVLNSLSYLIKVAGEALDMRFKWNASASKYELVKPEPKDNAKGMAEKAAREAAEALRLEAEKQKAIHKAQGATGLGWVEAGLGHGLTLAQLVSAIHEYCADNHVNLVELASQAAEEDSAKNLDTGTLAQALADAWGVKMKQVEAPLRQAS